MGREHRNVTDEDRFLETFDAWDNHVIHCEHCLESRSRDEPLGKMCYGGRLLYNEWVPWHNRVFRLTLTAFYEKV